MKLKTLKIIIGALALAATAALGASIAAAQDTAPKKENRAQELSAYLGLSADQQKQVAEIYKNEAERQRALMEETRQKINALLTPDQQQKYNEFLSIQAITPKPKAVEKTKEQEQDKPAGKAGK